MKVYINWDEWREFPFLHAEKSFEQDKPIEIPADLFARYKTLMADLEKLTDTIDAFQEKQNPI